MKEKILRKLFLGFMQVHILYHAKKEPIYGTWMMQELEEHGYKISPGTLYPLLRSMETEGLLVRTDENVSGRIIKFYRTTPLGEEVLAAATDKAGQLIREVEETKERDDST